MACARLSVGDRPNASLIPRTYLEINLNLDRTRFLYGEELCPAAASAADEDRPSFPPSSFRVARHSVPRIKAIVAEKGTTTIRHFLVRLIQHAVAEVIALRGR